LLSAVIACPFSVDLLLPMDGAVLNTLVASSYRTCKIE